MESEDGDGLIAAEDILGTEDSPGLALDGNEEVGEKETASGSITGSKSDKLRKRAAHQLNEKIVCSKKGLSELAKMFEGVEFKSGKEEQNLKKLLEYFEYWAHQLYPRYSFEDVVEKVEALGSKKVVKQHAHSVKTGEAAKLEYEEGLDVVSTDATANIETDVLCKGGDLEQKYF
ncbi:TIMELESS-interacting protein-like [Rhopilema esculentum]|uniref:TIMELESS-interacting protein-like n=1 Tax=Rhopilema esculentum TaxID=499914 RepID=UPI0031E24C27|eukprot:gene5018-125_t